MTDALAPWANPFWRPAQKRLGFQRSPATSPILRQPAIDRPAVDPHGSCDNFGAFASLYAAHGADAHLFQRRVIQLASIKQRAALREAPAPRGRMPRSMTGPVSAWTANCAPNAAAPSTASFRGAGARR